MIPDELKFLYVNKNGDCKHESLWKTKSGYCYVCRDELPLKRMLRLFQLLGWIKRLK